MVTTDDRGIYLRQAPQLLISRLRAVALSACGSLTCKRVLAHRAATLLDEWKITIRGNQHVMTAYAMSFLTGVFMTHSPEVGRRGRILFACAYKWRKKRFGRSDSGGDGRWNLLERRCVSAGDA